MTRAKLMFALFLLSALPRLHAQAALLVAEPYGRFGGMNPTGHAAVYLQRICAASPTLLRRCQVGESGSVISRYHKIAGYGWIVVPLIPYLYAVEGSTEMPIHADAETVAFLRDEYRRRHLQEVVPDGPQGESPKGAWVQLVGAAYDRKIYAFEIETSEAQDNEFIEEFNSGRNKGRFNLLFRNCADFARDIINFYYPKALRSSFIADAGITTPKQIAKSLVRYSKKHPELGFDGFVIAQIPGSMPRSKGVRGVLESLVRSKKYVVPLVVVQFWIPPSLAAGYLTTGRFNPSRYASRVFNPTGLEQRTLLATEPDLGDSKTELAARGGDGSARLSVTLDVIQTPSSGSLH